ncbi:hypothetical protein TNCV_1111371 [Trichonephila clavipes]|nr:hypothetical protein TNCV_1111371 [Trichonephila clavipes]
MAAEKQLAESDRLVQIKELTTNGRVVAYHAATPQVRGSILGLGKTDHLNGTSAQAPERPKVTCAGMGTVGPRGLLHL